MLGQSHVNISANERDQFMRFNKWGVRVIKRGTDYDSAEIVKMIGFPDEVIMARAMWPDDAMRVCNEHNDTLAKLLFKQD
jgi:hypothetical protein